MWRLFAVSAAVLVSVSARELPKAGGNVAILVGGTNGGVGSEVINEGKACSGDGTSPQFPLSSFSHNFGWVAGYHTLAGSPHAILCGGSDTTQSAECFNLRLGSSSWEDGKCFMPSARTHASMFSTMDGKVVISGGYNEQLGWLSDILILDEINPSECTATKSDCCSWTNLGSFNFNSVYAHCSLQYDQETMVFIGGNTWSDEFGQYDVPTVQILNTRTGKWRMGQNMTAPRQRTSCIKTEMDGRPGILVAGGYCHGNPEFDECYQLRLEDTIFYDFQANSWESAGKLSGARSGLYMAEVQGKVLVMGGEFRGNPLTTVEQWDPATKTWSDAGFELPNGLESFAAFTCSEDYYKC